MKYFAYLKQHGEGCDYMINCGVDIIQLKAEDMDEAISLSEDYIENDLGSDIVISECLVFQVSEMFNIEVDKIYERRQNNQANDIEKNERELYEKLKNKYGV